MGLFHLLTSGKKSGIFQRVFTKKHMIMVFMLHDIRLNMVVRLRQLAVPNGINFLILFSMNSWAELGLRDSFLRCSSKPLAYLRSFALAMRCKKDYLFQSSK